MDGAALIIGLFRRFRSIVLQREVEIIGQCRLCGNCCHGILLKDGASILRSKRQYERLCEVSPKHRWFDIIGKDDFGNLEFACSRRGDDGLCTCYEDRLQLCKDYPTKSLYYQGGWIGGDCGFSFKAVTFRDVFMRRKRARIPAFSEILKKEQDKNRSAL